MGMKKMADYMYQKGMSEGVREANDYANWTKAAGPAEGGASASTASPGTEAAADE